MYHNQITPFQFGILDKFVDGSERPREELIEFDKDCPTMMKKLHFATKLMWRYGIHPRGTKWHPNGHCFFFIGHTHECVHSAIVQHIPLAENLFDTDPREAFVHINKAIALSRHPDSQGLYSRALCVRARMYFKLSAYLHCMRSLDMARSLSGSMDLWLKNSLWMVHRCEQAKLRMADALAVQGHLDHEPYVFDRTFDAQQRQAWLQSTFDSGMRRRRRRVQFNRNCEFGRIVGIDRALFPSLAVTEDGLRCAYCFDENTFELMPCLSHSACKTLYCSRKCRRLAYESWHKYECRLDNFLHLYPIFRPIVRLVCTTFRAKTHVHEMMKFTRMKAQRRADEHNVFTYAKMETLPGLYQAKLAYSLPTKKSEHDTATRFYYFRMATYAYKTLKHCTPLVTDLFRKGKERLWLRLFIHDCLITMSEHGRMQFAYSSVRLPGREVYDKRPLAYGLYPLSATIPHSCQPNVAVYSSGYNEMVLCTVNVLRTHDELTIDQTLAGNNRHGHQKRLATALRVACNCPPALTTSLLLEEQPWPEWDTVMQTLWSHQTRQVLQFLDVVREYAELNGHYGPCLQLKANMTCFSLCLERLLMGPMMRDDFVYDRTSNARRLHAMYRLRLIGSTPSVMALLLMTEKEAFDELQKWKSAGKKNRRRPASEQNLRQTVQHELATIGNRSSSWSHTMLERRNTLPAHIVQVEPLPISKSLVYSQIAKKESITSSETHSDNVLDEQE